MCDRIRDSHSYAVRPDTQFPQLRCATGYAIPTATMCDRIRNNHSYDVRPDTRLLLPIIPLGGRLAETNTHMSSCIAA
eukprot:gene25579-biopygen13532